MRPTGAAGFRPARCHGVSLGHAYRERLAHLGRLVIDDAIAADARNRIALAQAIEQTLIATGDRVKLRLIGERIDVGGIKEGAKAMGVARGLAEAVVEAAATGTRGMRNHAIESLAPGLQLIEALIEEMTQQTAGLRNPDGDGAVDLDRALLGVTQPSSRIA